MTDAVPWRAVTFLAGGLIELWKLGFFMVCSGCGVKGSAIASSCSNCRKSYGSPSSNSVNTRGGDIGHGVYQAGGNMYINHSSQTSDQPTYEAVPLWRSPITQGILSWLSFLVGLAGVFSLSKFIYAFTSVADIMNESPRNYLVWAISVLIAAFVLAVVFQLRRITALELRKPLFLGLSISGSDHRLSVEKIQVSVCPRCRGKMRYINKPMEWIERIDANGNETRKITKRGPAVECVRNADHFAWVDPAE